MDFSGGRAFAIYRALVGLVRPLCWDWAAPPFDLGSFFQVYWQFRIPLKALDCSQRCSKTCSHCLTVSQIHFSSWCNYWACWLSPSNFQQNRPLNYPETSLFCFISFFWFSIFLVTGTTAGDGWTAGRWNGWPLFQWPSPFSQDICTDLLRLFSFFDKIKNLKNDKKTKPNCFSGKSQTNVTMPSVKVGHGFESEQDTIKENWEQLRCW